VVVRLLGVRARSRLALGDIGLGFVMLSVYQLFG